MGKKALLRVTASWACPAILPPKQASILNWGFCLFSLHELLMDRALPPALFHPLSTLRDRQTDG